MLTSQKLSIKSSELRQRLNELAALESLTDEHRAEIETTTKALNNSEIQYRAAVLSEGAEERAALEAEPDAEMRERLELRSRASLAEYLVSATRGVEVRGAESELQAAAGIDDGRSIPLELWDIPVETRADMATDAPTTVGVNLDRIRPAVFAQSVLPRLGVEMPRVPSGTYANATISTSLTAGSHAAGAAAESSKAAFTVSSATPKRITARLSIRIEDIAAVGQANFESSLRENLALVLSDELDDQGLNGAAGNSGADLTGLFERLTNPGDPTAVSDFGAFAAAHAGGVDGLWASTIRDVAIVTGPDSYRLAARTFQTTTGSAGELSAAAYAMRETGGFWTNRRMPDAVSNIQQSILYRKGRSMMGGSGAMRTAVCPHWNMIGIDDIYSDSASGERHFTMHVLLGDVILVQPDAYAQVAYRLA